MQSPVIEQLPLSRLSGATMRAIRISRPHMIRRRPGPIPVLSGEHDTAAADTPAEKRKSLKIRRLSVIPVVDDNRFELLTSRTSSGCSTS